MNKEKNDFTKHMKRKKLLENYVEQLSQLTRVMELLSDTVDLGRSICEESFDKYYDISQSAFVLNLNLKKALIVALQEVEKLKESE